MPIRPGTESIDYARLGLFLRVLGVANRLELLRKLQVPQAAGDIRLNDPRAKADGTARPISRQAVDAHIHSLEALGLVRSRKAGGPGRAVTEYFLDHARLFVIADELRRISLLRPTIPTATAVPTSTIGAAPDVPPGPALVLATGPMEGTIFPLTGPGPWTLGRDRAALIVLPYDPFVSRLNARIQRQGERFTLETHASAPNGTRVNWRGIAPGQKIDLRAGDAIGIGRSLLFVRGLAK